MNCNVVEDLLPLYIDACCSEDTKELVESHVATCPRCREQLAQMKQELGTQAVPEKVATRQNPVLLWKASILQVALFFLSFLVMAWGVSWEARIPIGLTNGMFAMNLVVPVTAFMLSLANWFFIQQYRSRKQFRFFSCVLHIAVYLVGLIWVLNHYEWLDAPFNMEAWMFYAYVPGIGVGMTVFLDILMWGLSNVYAKLLGKE